MRSRSLPLGDVPAVALAGAVDEMLAVPAGVNFVPLLPPFRRGVLVATAHACAVTGSSTSHVVWVWWLAGEQGGEE